ncbi:MAG: hypothetical protein CFE28_01495 [Alphaproteobacteria bacterium PA2]|nr:MAG: hypothetical protein CFE28_01495 [Alphaproteobacteria bacterium PA2]
MRLTPLLPLIALLGLAACDSAKVAALTGAKPVPTTASGAACTPNPLPACAPAPGAAPAAMAPEGDKVAVATGDAGQAMTGAGANTAATTADDRFASTAATNSTSRVNTAYAAANHRHTYTRRAVHRTQTAKARKVVVVRKNYYIRDTRYVTVDRPVYQPQPQVIYEQPRRAEVYVDREIDRTSSAYGRQVYNRYEHSAGPPVVYRGLYRQEQRAYSGARREGYAYHQSGYGYQSGGGYQGQGHQTQGYQAHGYQAQGYQAQGADCRCTGTPAAGRDRDGYLTWPGKTESRQY